MKSVSGLAFAVFLSGCVVNVPGLTSHTDVPLELKGYRTGMSLPDCPAGAVRTMREGRMLSCVMPRSSLGGTGVKASAIVALDGSIVTIRHELERPTGFSQTGVLQALTEKFGPPARGAAPSTWLWSNGNDQLQLQEIQGAVILLDTVRSETMRSVNAKSGVKDL